MRPNLAKALHQNETNLKTSNIVDEFEYNTRMFKIVDKAIEFGWNRCAEKFSHISPFMTKEDCYAVSNKRAVKRSIKDGSLKTVLKGKRIYIVRESFERWVLKNELTTVQVEE